MLQSEVKSSVILYQSLTQGRIVIRKHCEYLSKGINPLHREEQDIFSVNQCSFLFTYQSLTQGRIVIILIIVLLMGYIVSIPYIGKNSIDKIAVNKPDAGVSIPYIGKNRQKKKRFYMTKSINPLHREEQNKILLLKRIIPHNMATFKSEITKQRY